MLVGGQKKISKTVAVDPSGWGAGDAPPLWRGSPAPSLGLSCAHICPENSPVAPAPDPESGSVTWAKGGSMVKMNDGSRGRGGGGGRVGARRGQVHGFSYGSRRRMIDAVSSVDLDQVSGIFFVTLTAPHATWELIEEWRRAWMKRLLRRWGHLRFSVLWRKEPHESGRPHLHCLIYFLDPVPQLVSGFRPWNERAERTAYRQGHSSCARAFRQRG